MTMGIVAEMGGFQFHSLRLRCRCSRPAATNVLTMARGYEMRLRAMLGMVSGNRGEIGKEGRGKGGHLLQDEVVGISWRRSKHDDDGHKPVLKQTSQGGVEGFVAGPEAGEWQNTLAAELLHETTLREDDAENVSKSGKGHKDGEGALGGAAKHVAEEGCGDKATGGQDLLLWHGGEVGNVDKHVQDGDDADGHRRGNLERSDGVLGLAEGVVGVAVADVAPDDVVERCDNTVGTSRGPLKGIREVVGLLVLGQLDVAGESNPAGNDNDQDDEYLDGAQDVLESDPPLQRCAVDEERGRDAGQADYTLVPTPNLDICCV